MATTEELQPGNMEWVERFKRLSDQSAIKGFLLSSLLKSLETATDYFARRSVFETVEILQKSGEIKVKKQDKKLLMNVIQEEFVNIKAQHKILKEVEKYLEPVVRRVHTFCTTYAEEVHQFDDGHGFFWREKGGMDNFDKLLRLDKALDSLQLPQFAGFLKKFESVVPADKEVSEFLEHLAGFAQGKFDLQGRKSTTGVTVKYFLAQRKKGLVDKKAVRSLQSAANAGLMNTKITKLVASGTAMVTAYPALPPKIKLLKEVRQKEVVRLQDEKKKLKSAETIPGKTISNKEAGKFRVLVLSHEFEKGGGVATVTRNISEQGNKHSSLVADVLVHGPPKSYAMNTAPYEFYYKGKKKFSFGTLDEVLLFLTSFHYKILHVHSLSFASILRGGLPQFKGLSPGSKVVYTCHSVVAHERTVQEKHRPWGTVEVEAQEEILAMADKITHLTFFGAIIAHGTAAEFLTATGRKQNSYYPQYRSKSCIIPNGIVLDYHFFSNLRHSLRSKIAGRREIVLGYVGRLAEEKGVVNLAKVFPTISSEFPQLKLHIVGLEYPGSGIENLMRYHLQSVMGHVEFKGWKEGPALDVEFEHMDLVIIPSFNESFSLVTLEAFAFNTPVIISKVDGPKELFVETKQAVGIDPHNPETIQDAVRFCMEHPDQVVAMMKEGRKQIKEKYNWAIITREYEKLYHAVSKNGVFISDFSEPEENTLPLTNKFERDNQIKVGMYYGQEFWSSFIHLLEEEGFTVSAWGVGFHKEPLEEFIKRNDVIVTCSASADKWVEVTTLCKKHGKPQISRYGGGMGLKQDNVAKEKYRDALRETTLLAPTDLLSSAVLSALHIPTSRQILVPNPVDLSVLDKSSKDFSLLRGRFRLPQQKVVLGFIGRIDPMRNTYYLVKAFEGLCEKLRKTGQENHLTLFVLGKLMTNYSISSSYFPGTHGNFAAELTRSVERIINTYGGSNRVSGLSNAGGFGGDNIIFEPLKQNVKHNLYLNLLASCDIICMPLGYGVGSNRALGEALGLGRRILTLDALTNPYAYGPVGIFINRQLVMGKEGRYQFFMPNLRHFTQVLEHINSNKAAFSGNYPAGRAYIEKTMSAEFVVKERLAPAIRVLVESYDPVTGSFDNNRIEELYNQSYAVMHDSKFDPTRDL